LAISVKNIKSDVANIAKAILFVYESDKKLCFARFGLITIQSVLPLASLYLLKLLVDSITDSSTLGLGNIDYSLIWIYVTCFCAVFLVMRISNVYNAYTDEILTQKLIDYISSLLHKKSAELDLAFYDKSEYHDTFHRAQQEANYRPIQILKNLTGIVRDGLSLVGIVIILTSLSVWVITILILAALPALFVKLWKSKIIYDWRNKNTFLFRKANYFSKLLTNREYAKEVRVFNLANHFQKQFNSIRKSLVKEILKIVKDRAKFDLLSAVFEVGALFAFIILLYQKTFTGAITIGSFVMFFEAFRRGQGFMDGIVTKLAGLYNNKLFLNNLFKFLELKPGINSPHKSTPFPDKIKKGIEFKNVSFSYPGSEKMILNNLSFEAKQGKLTQIHGVNGAGKTTMIKLLCRLYECTTGTIYIDGISIKDFNLHELRKNISVIFQDFAQYDFTVKENIDLGDIENRNRLGKIRKAAKLSSADKIIEDLPNSYDTLLGKYFEKGEELSMGQWQRIALTRALNKGSPVLILDEPTSWMDKDTESDFYKQLYFLSRNKVLLLISHSNTGKLENINNDFIEEKSSKQLVFNLKI
jgi:ATP-binding cassette, subfamily B, bacterial